jgi:hypothetical protein
VVFVIFVCPKTTGEKKSKNKGSIVIFANNTGYLKTAITYSFSYLPVRHLNEVFPSYFDINRFNQVCICFDTVFLPRWKIIIKFFFGSVFFVYCNVLSSQF